MDEPLKQFINFYTEHRKKDVDEDIRIAEEIRKDLLAKLPKIIEHFGGFEEASVIHMLGTYAHERHRFTKNAKYYTERVEKIQLEFRPEAGECLKYILNKKLFDAECLWRAGQLELQGIETTSDFHRWKRDLFHCPFIEPITQQEVDMLVNYLNQHPEEAAFNEHTYDWQHYEYLKLCFLEREGLHEEFYENYTCAVINDNGIPPWYDYYDSIMGRKYLALADIKFPKELYYRRLYSEHKKKKEAEQLKKEGKTPPKPQPYLRKPWLGMDRPTDEAIAELVKTFEPREIQKLHESYCIVEKETANYKEPDYEEEEDDEMYPGEEEKDDDDDMDDKKYSHRLDEEVENVWHNLQALREPMPVQMNADWRVALIVAYREYKIKKIIETIPAAYNEYQMRLETGIGFEKPDEKELPQYMLDSKKEILEGRKLSGEPQNFNY